MIAATMTVRWRGLGAALLLCPALAVAFQSPQAPVFRSGVELIDVAVVVRDRDGRFVEGLTAADFQVTEADAPQTIAAFDRVSIPVWRPEPADAAPPIAADVSSNEGVGDGRIFVLVLDALHVSASSLAAVRLHARRFVEQHVGRADLAAVLAPGSIDGASQDFTSDKAKLLAAIDRFTGTKLRSATIELEEERQAAALSGIMMHGGRDPSDAERASRARSLSSVLEALAGHLERVERRRKALLLFSEGIDYNTADVMGTVQQHASDVVHALKRAIGALMRTNVSLYAIDPRALSATGSPNTDRVPHVAAPNAPRADGSLPRLDLSEPSLDAEFAASLQSLRHIAEATGGFAAVTSNDVSEAFGRVVAESSDYYVLGYTPTRRGKPGEFRPIKVRVLRPGVRVLARSGYVVPKEQRPPAAVAPFETPASPAALRRPTPGRSGAIVAEEPPRPKTVPGDLASLLATPLPAAGLPLRVQAAPFRGSGNKATIQVVIEVGGSSLAFAERGGRFETRIELASITVDSRGRGGNGRSTRMDLRLTSDEVQRVKSTGVRWISRLELTPGRYHLRVAGRAPASGATGLVTADVDVPAFENRLSLSGVTLTSLPSVLMVTKGEARLATVLETPPTAARTFVSGDRVLAGVEVYVPQSYAVPGQVIAEVTRLGGTAVLQREQRLAHVGRGARASEIGFAIETASLGPGRYVLRIHIEGTKPSAVTERRVPFDVVAPPSR